MASAGWVVVGFGHLVFQWPERLLQGGIREDVLLKYYVFLMFRKALTLFRFAFLTGSTYVFEIFVGSHIFQLQKVSWNVNLQDRRFQLDFYE